MDCGPTCLRMVAKHYGRNYPLHELRNKSFITREGVSLLGISDAAEAIGFRTLGVKIPFDKLFKDAVLPCVAHWYQRHFVVIYKITAKEIFVADPAAGLVSYTHEEFKKGWLSAKENGHESGVALLLEPTPEFYEREPESAKNKKKSLTYLLGYLAQHRRFIIQLILGLLAGSIIQLALPFLTQSIVDVGINTQNIQFIYLVLAGQFVLFFSRLSVDFIRRWILLHLSTRINISIISDFLIKLFKLPMQFFEGKMIGDILRRIEDHTRIERFLSTSSLNILFSLFNLVVFGIVLAIYNVPIFLVFFSMSTVYVAFILLFLKKRAELDYKRFQQMADNQSSLIQSVQGMSEIKMNNCETQKRWEWERIQAKLFHINVQSTRLPELFEINVDAFLESTQYNSCLNKKISIDSEGKIKNCPSMPEDFGSIKDKSLVDVSQNPIFKKYWRINKNEIETCKDCEFRHICSDCRAHIKDNKNIYSKPLKCHYDPYTATWENG